MQPPGPRGVTLRAVADRDVDHFFEHQLDATATRMAAFTSKDPRDRQAFLERWDRIRADAGVVVRSIVYGSRVAGHILRFEQFEQPSVSYWLGRDYWGKGVATSALLCFLEFVPERPLFARVAKDNRASLRVLQKCGFAEVGSDVAFAPGRGVAVEEVILRLGRRSRSVGHPTIR